MERGREGREKEKGRKKEVECKAEKCRKESTNCFITLI